MRIGMMVDTYKPHVSGITNYIDLNKRFLEKLGHEVFIFTFGDVDYKDDEINVIRSPGLPLTGTDYYLSLRYSHLARRQLYTMELVHVHHPFLSGSLALLYCRPRNIPLIFTNHTRYDLYAQAYLPILPDSIGITALKAYLPSFCRACDLVIAPSQGLRGILEKFGVDAPIEVVPNGVDLERFQGTHEPLDRGLFGFSPDDIVLVYVGRLGPEKNLSFLLRCFAGLAHAYENVGLLLVGDGPEGDELKERVHPLGIASKVHFTGMVPYEQIPSYLAAADAFVTASVTEVHPLSVIEAMAAGLPVLGIYSPGVGDTVEDGITGFLTTEDVAAFTAKMVRLVTEHDKRIEMGHQARQAVKKYDIQLTTQMMLKQYQNLVAGSRSKQRGLRYQLTRLLDRWNG